MCIAFWEEERLPLTTSGEGRKVQTAGSGELSVS